MKVSNEDFLQRLFAKNPNIEPQEEYKGSKVNILCQCRMCEHEWMARPGNLLSGKGCPVCAIRNSAIRRTKAPDDFILELAIKNPIVDSVEPYLNMNTKILFRCKKCQYEWYAKPSHVLAGHGCPKCGGSMKKDHGRFIVQLAKINSEIEVLESYVNARTKLLCRCSYCKNEWYATPDKLLQGNGCPMCDKRNKTSFPEQAIYYYIKKIYPDAVNRYCLPNSRIEIDIFIPSLKIGVEYDGMYWHASRLSSELDKYKKLKENGITLYRVRESTEIIQGIADNIIIRHKPYNFNTLDLAIKKLINIFMVDVLIDTLKDSASIREQFYTDLSSNSLLSLYPLVAKEWSVEKNGTITPKMVSYGSNEKFWWKCSTCHNEWMASVADRTIGSKGCSKCAKNKLSQLFKMKHCDFVDRLNNINPNLSPLEEYKTTHEPILTLCKICGNRWFAAPSNLLKGRGCPVCTRKHRAKKTSV